MDKNRDETKKPNTASQDLILALETSGRAGSVALATISQMLAEISFSGQMRHSAELFPTIASLLQGADKTSQNIGEIYISAGPGSFTGLRIAVAFAKTMNLATGAKIISLDTLDVIAANTADYIATENPYTSRIAVLLDAKRGQFFTAVYQGNLGKLEKILPDCLMTPDEFIQKFAGQSPIRLLGEGLVYYKDKFKAPGISFFDESLWTPRASQVYKLGLAKSLAGQFSDPLTLQPLYLRHALDEH